MVRAFAGDSTMTRRPRPAEAAAGPFVLEAAELGRLVVARRGLADESRGIVLQGLHAMRAGSTRERIDRRRHEGRGASGAER